ncbi:lipid II flippase MurJ [subsurface metagenome]
MDYSIKSMRDTTKLLGSRGFIAIFSLLYFIIITRLFTKVELSSLAIFGIITGLCSMLTGLGLSGTCLQKSPEFFARGEKARACTLIQLSTVIPLFLSFFAGGMVFLGAKQISQIFFKTTDFANWIKIMAFGVMAYRLHDSLSHMLMVTQKFGKLSIASMINNIGGKIIALAFYLLLGITGYLWGLILGYGMTVLFIVYHLRKFLFCSSRPYSLKGLVSYSFPYYINGLVRFATMQADQIIIGIFLMPQQLATYYVARRFFDYLILYVGALLEPVLPKIAELKSRGIQAVEKAFRKTSRYLCFSLIPVSFLVAALSYPLLQIYGGGKYLEGTPVLVILSLTIILYGVYTIYGMNVYILGKPVEKLKQESVSSGLNVILGLLLVLPLNILGLALARLLSFSGGGLFAGKLLKKIGKVQFDVGALKQTLLASLAMAAFITGAQILYYRLYIIPLYLLLGIFIYLVIFSRYLEKEDMKLMKDFLPGRLSFLIRPLYFLGAGRN